MSLCEKVVSNSKRKNETVEVQVALKGYDLKRDKKFDASVELPHQKRPKESVIVIGDSELEAMANEAGLTFISFTEVEGKDKDKKTLKKKLASKNHSIITTKNFHKYFEIFYFNRKKTPFYLFDQKESLKSFHERITRTIKLKLRQTNVISFPVGYVDMGPPKLSENIHKGVEFLVTLLKKGGQNIDTIHLKSTQGKPLRLK